MKKIIGITAAVLEECLEPVDVKSRVEAPGGRTFPMSRQVPQARPARPTPVGKVRPCSR